MSSLYYSTVKSIRDRYRKWAQPLIEKIAIARKDLNLTTEGRERLIDDLTGQLKAAHAKAAVEISRSVVTATDMFRDREPEFVQRRAGMSTQGAVRAQTLRSLLNGVPNSELLRAAHDARTRDESAEAHGIRLELEARIAAGTIKAREVLPIREALVFPRLAERYNIAVADLVCASVEQADFVTSGYDWTVTKTDRAYNRLSNFRRAASVPEHDGVSKIAFNQHEVAAMRELLGEPDATHSPEGLASAKTPLVRIEAFRATKRQEAEDAKNREERERAAAATTATRQKVLATIANDDSNQ